MDREEQIRFLNGVTVVLVIVILLVALSSWRVSITLSIYGGLFFGVLHYKVRRRGGL